MINNHMEDLAPIMDFVRHKALIISLSNGRNMPILFQTLLDKLVRKLPRGVPHSYKTPESQTAVHCLKITEILLEEDHTNVFW